MAQAELIEGEVFESRQEFRIDLQRLMQALIRLFEVARGAERNAEQVQRHEITRRFGSQFLQHPDRGREAPLPYETDSAIVRRRAIALIRPYEKREPREQERQEPKSHRSYSFRRI